MTLLVSLPQNSLSANEDICFTEDVAKELMLEINVCRETNGLIFTMTQDIKLERETTNSIFDNYEERLSVMGAQSQDEHDRAEKYRLEWKECGQSLTKCQQSKPSRATWFGGGFGTALLIIVIIIAL